VELPVHNIMMINVLSLLICTANYSALSGERTAHMTLFLIFVMHLMPEIIDPEVEARFGLLNTMQDTQDMTPESFFETFAQNQGAVRGFGGEMAKDLEDTIDFYHLTFRQIRAGETKSNSIFMLPDR
jgi:hypothetical protein